MKALIVIDVQNDFVTGPLGTPEARAIIPKVQQLASEFLKNGDAIYYTQDTHNHNYLKTKEGLKLPVKHCIYGTDGWNIVNSVDIIETPRNKVYHLCKDRFGYDAWEDEDLDKYDEVWVCGLVSSICVISNLLIIKMLYPKLDIKFIASASAGLTPENHLAAIEIAKCNQIEVVE